MPEPFSPEAPRQPLAQPEQPASPREKKQFSITVDNKEVSYPEDYPHQFIADGAPASIRRIMGGMSSDKEELGHAINAYLEPSQKVFENADNLPEWYQQTLGPILERNHLSLTDVKPADTHILGDDFRWALEDIYNFPFPQQLQIAAARHMGQTEGTVPTLSALMNELRKSDSIRFEELITTLLKRGPDGFAMAAYLVAPKAEEHAEEPKINFDKAFSVGADGSIQIDPKALEELRNVSFDAIKQAFEKRRGNISYDAWRKVIDSAEYQNSHAVKPGEVQPGSGTNKAGNREETEPAVDPQAVRDFYGTAWEDIRKGFDKGVTDIDFTPSDKIVHPENYRFNESKSEEEISQSTSKTQKETGKNDWYNAVMIPAMDQVLKSGVFQRVAEFKPANPDEQINFQGLENGLQALFDVIIPPHLLSEITSGKDSKEPLTLGHIVQQFADRSPLSLQDIITHLMQKGPEGYVIADTIARSVYHVPETYGTPTPAGAEYTNKQADIPPAIKRILDFPLPNEALAATLGEKFHLPTIGMIFEKLSDEQSVELLKTLQGNYVSRLIAFDATHQADMRVRLAE